MKILGLAMIVLAGTGILSGCRGGAAPLPQKETGKPASAGVVYLSMGKDLSPDPPDNAPTLARQRSHPLRDLPAKEPVSYPRITVATIVNRDGATVATSVLPVYAGDLLAAALREQLTSLGYTVLPAGDRSALPGKGVRVSGLEVALTGSRGLLLRTGNCQLRLDLELLRNGSQASRSFQANLSASTFADQNLLFRNLLEEAVQQITAQALPFVREGSTAAGNR